MDAKACPSFPVVAYRLVRRGLLPLLLLELALLGLLLEGCRSLRGGQAERPPFRRVSPPVAYEIVRDTPDILILDLRTREEYLGEAGHLPRAFNIPLDRLPFRLGQIGAWRDDTILVYCRAGDTCGEEGMAVLLSSGFDAAILMDGGIDGWIEDGFKTERPAEVAGRQEGETPAQPGAPAAAATPPPAETPPP